jgi:hypothetical protein
MQNEVGIAHVECEASGGNDWTFRGVAVRGSERRRRDTLEQYAGGGEAPNHSRVHSTFAGMLRANSERARTARLTQEVRIPG